MLNFISFSGWRFRMAMFLLGAGIFLTACPPPPKQMTFELSADKSSYQLGETVSLEVTLTNGTDTQPLKVVKPTISPNLVYFEVKDANGQLLRFKGPWLKLKPFQQGQFVDLNTNQSISNKFVLGDLYEITQTGAYTLTARYRNYDDGSRFGYQAFTTNGLQSNSITLQFN